MWHQPCQRCKYTTSVDIQKRAIKKKLFTHVESHASAVSLLNSGEQCYIKVISNINFHSFICNLLVQKLPSPGAYVNKMTHYASGWLKCQFNEMSVAVLGTKWQYIGHGLLLFLQFSGITFNKEDESEVKKCCAIKSVSFFVPFFIDRACDVSSVLFISLK